MRKIWNINFERKILTRLCTKIQMQKAVKLPFALKSDAFGKFQRKKKSFQNHQMRLQNQMQ